MPVVDAHAHFFSRPFFEALALQSPLPGTVGEKLAALSRETGIEVPGKELGDHLGRWIAALDANGVDHMVTFASLPEETGAVAEAVRSAPTRLTGIALVNPLAPGAARRAEELLEGGAFRGILTFPAMHHFELAGAEMRAVLAALAPRRALCYVHCGSLVVRLRDRLGLPRLYDLSYANPLALIPLANAFPEVAFVVPHFGAGLFRETLLAGMQCENVFVDTSSSNSWIAVEPGVASLRDVLGRTLDVFGPGRILFGTDSNVFPAGWRRERYEEQRLVLAGLGLPQEEQDAIFGRNVRRLLALG